MQTKASICHWLDISPPDAGADMEAPSPTTGLANGAFGPLMLSLTE